MDLLHSLCNTPHTTITKNFALILASVKIRYENWIKMYKIKIEKLQLKVTFDGFTSGNKVQ